MASSKEFHLDENVFMVCKTDPNGVITYLDLLMCEITGYKESELLGSSYINFLKHPDMPEVILALIRENLETGKEAFIFTKNLRKDNTFYWAFSQVIPIFDSHNTLNGLHTITRWANPDAVRQIAKLYNEIKQIEDSSGLGVAYQILTDYLNSLGLDYHQYIFGLQSKEGFNPY